MNLNQLIIGLTGPLGFWMTLWKPRKRWAKVGLGMILLGQPFWLLESYRAGQWGIFIVSLMWTVAWARAAWEECRR